MDKKRRQEFWLQTMSASLGTIVGIILTFGTTLLLQNCEQRRMERTTTLMVIHNLDDFCNKLSGDVDDLKTEDSLNIFVLNNLNRLNQIPNDTLSLFLNNLMEVNVSIFDNSTENIFTTNIDTWKNIGSSEFVENAGKCFAFKRMTIDVINEIRREKLQVRDTLIAICEYCDHPVKTQSETVKQLFKSPITRQYIGKLHWYYISWMKGVLTILKDQNAKNKELMHMTDEELNEFGENKMKMYHSPST